jgi:heme exporter protein C
LKNNWWKILASFLIIYSVIGGFLMPVPKLPILHETIRNLYFHVPMWFAMIILFVGALIYSVKFLLKGHETDDLKAVEMVNVGILFGILGLVTGMVWANYTWGQPWSSDPKQNGTAALLLIYFAYFILRSSITDDHQRAKVSAVYNIFAAVSIYPLIFFLPRMTDSLHPGNGGNPAFSSYDLDSNMRLVFYPAVIGWILIGLWIANLRIRLKTLERNEEEI